MMSGWRIVTLQVAGVLFFLTGMDMDIYAQTRHTLSNIHFYQLNTAHGLSDNYIHDMCTDKSGNLWIGTGDGLNMFNGKSVVKYFSSDHPQMQNSYIRRVECDEKNRIWFSSDGFISVMDERRRIHKIRLEEDGKKLHVRMFILTKSEGIVVLAGWNHYRLNENIDLSTMDSLSLSDFSKLDIKGFGAPHMQNFKQIRALQDDRFYYGYRDSFFIIDYKTLTMGRKHLAPEITALGSWDKNHLMIYHDATKTIAVLDERSDSISFPFDTVRDQVGKPMKGVFVNALEISPGVYLFTTTREGIYIYDQAAHKLFNHKHNAADPTTIVNNYPHAIAADGKGWVFVGATPNGISYFQSNAVIRQKTLFIDNLGNSYDGFISNIETRDNNTYYIATNDNLIRWNRGTNKTTFMLGPALHLPFDDAAVNFVLLDGQDRLWACLPGQGMCVFDKSNKLIRYLNFGTAENKNVYPNYPRHMEEAPDGSFWIATGNGIFILDTKTFSVKRPPIDPLKGLEGRVCTRIWHQDEDNVWIATASQGAWHYQFSTQQLKIYNTENGLIDNNVFTIQEDNLHNVYIGSESGLDIFLKNGTRRRITTREGLLYGRVEALLCDKKNRMWIGNDVALACYSISDNTLKVFDERYGLSVQGFRLNAYHQNSDDELIWGTERGIQYFYPDDLYDQEITLKTTIYRVESRNISTDLTMDEEIDLPSGKDFISFYFSTIDYSKHLYTFYQYKLEGLDEDWIHLSDQKSVRYNSLSPGTYTFRVRASNDKKDWVEAENEVTVHKASFFWERTWFEILAFGIAVSGIYWLVTALNRKQKKRTEELETEVVINYFASRINTHQTTEELLWDVAKNCISRLKFEDCVIYVLDEEREVMVQKAAFGPKSADDKTIHQPIDIPLGKGIVGSVAVSGKPELIKDTAQDSRYIVDDIERQSEIAVPIILENKVIGVIDSEHSKKNFFTQKHLGILTTISVLCVNQILRNKAELEKQQAKIEVLENKQKATESRLQSLRLQMNPHFLFNALNSIQQMILANEEMVATRYLSRFSKLLRTILIHSDKENISLKEEIEILRLYVELESVRFKDAFNYEILCDDEIDTDEVRIPTLLIQPFVENAIWHGLMHKEGNRRLSITFSDKHDHVECVIEDNGIGRKKSAEIKLAAGHNNHTSKGIKVSVERLNAMQKNGSPPGSMQIVDLIDESGTALGTRVQINLPIQN